MLGRYLGEFALDYGEFALRVIATRPSAHAQVAARNIPEGGPGRSGRQGKFQAFQGRYKSDGWHCFD
jgi:hypothetical protein